MKGKEWSLIPTKNWEINLKKKRYGLPYEIILYLISGGINIQIIKMQ